jgi:carboxymethylenebutenolidase
MAGGTETQGDVVSYVVWPPRKDRPLPAVVVVSDMWGDGDHLRGIADRVAAAGYLAVAPDLYAGTDASGAITADRIAAAKGWCDGVPPTTWMDPAARAEALGRLGPEGNLVRQTLDRLFEGAAAPERFARALEAAVGVATRHDAADHGPVGAMGFCMGGGLVGRLACHESRLGAAVVFYGAPPPSERVAGAACPVLGLYGEEDHPITDAVPELARAMAAAGRRFESVIYPGAPHAFFNETRSAYRVAAARDAWIRTLAFFADELGGGARSDASP